MFKHLKFWHSVKLFEFQKHLETSVFDGSI